MDCNGDWKKPQRLATRALLGWCALSALACDASAPDPTQVVVLIDAEPQTRERSDGLHFWVTAQDEPHTVLDEMTFNPDWPIKLVLEPRHDDTDRTYQVVAETGDNTMKLVTRARMKSGYVDGQIRYVRLVLEDACVDISPGCEITETCHQGACVTSIRVEPERFATSEARAPNAAELDLVPATHAQASDAGDQPGD